LGEGRVDSLQLDRDGTLWAATEGGLSRIKDGRVATLTSKNGLPCDTVHWAMEDEDHAFWLYTACGLVRIARPQLDVWATDPKNGRSTPRFSTVPTASAIRAVAALAHVWPSQRTENCGSILSMASASSTRVNFPSIPPRNCRFRVMAANNSGVWNEAGSFLDFSVAPAYCQTTWFRLSSVAALLALLAALYQLRVRYLAQQFNLRMEERVTERTRIARELHDTLLQSFQGVMLKFHAIKYLIHDRPDEAEQTLERVLEQARQAIGEGRDAVQALRSSTVVTNDLALAIGAIGERLAADHAGGNAPGFRIEVQGASMDLVPPVRDEVYRIAVEALRNAFRHSREADRGGNQL
jgi:signal transduction histidine kinase